VKIRHAALKFYIGNTDEEAEHGVALVQI